MPIRRIAITGETVLHQPALTVAEITLEIKELVSDMFDTMTAAPGVGLAATQVGVGLRIFVYDYEQDEIHYRGVAINPTLEVGEILDLQADEDTDSEGCLSIPGERYPLKRSDTATLHATDLAGSPYTIAATGWLARIFQHEYDHLDGVLYADRLIKPYQRELKKVYKYEGWGVPGQSWMPGEDDLEA
ncbi:peptide deformylase [Candidatus Aquiluna sp. UB-MaderosW2red]|nr:peptide deformylase [Candidatus Aquiluna sp. UB-MaderosW2red]